MSTASKKLAFRPLVVIAGWLATALTLIFPALQAGSWVNEHAVWIVWAIIAARLVAVVLLAALLAALKENLKGAMDTIAAETKKSRDEASEAEEAKVASK